MDGHHECSSNGSSRSSSSFLCRQSSSRWIPTADQIRILRELYYINGVRSPTAEQIQRISARLRQYGKIEGKNVFYWFQNHKARERQKKKLTVDHIDNNSNSSTIITTNNDVGNGYGGGAPVFMERSIRESCFSAGGGDGSAVVGIEPAGMPWTCHYIKEEGAAATREIETLPLFPTHSQDQEEDQEEEHKYYNSCNDYYCTQPPNGYLPAAYYLGAGAQAQENYHHH